MLDRKKTTVKGWVARDETGTLYFYKKEPKRVKPCDDYGYWDAQTYDTPFEIDRESFPIDWDDWPKEAELTIKLINTKKP